MNKINVKPLYKLLLCILGFIFLFSSLTITSNSVVKADNEDMPIVTIQSRTGEDSVHRGKAFTIDITLSNNSRGLTGLFLTLVNYDKTVFTLTNIEEIEDCPFAFTTSNEESELGYNFIDSKTGGFNLLWDAEKSVKYEGVIARLTFSSSIKAETKDYNIEFTYSTKNTRYGYNNPTEIDLRNSIVTLVTGNYNVYYKNYDDTILNQFALTDEDEFPVYSNTPSREEDAEYTYKFDGWENIVTDEKNDIVYRAKYSRTAKDYQIFLYVDGEYYSATICAFNQLIELNNPSKDDHTFFGWYTDEGCTSKLSSLYMPAHDLYLYGRFNYNIREDDIPKIALYHSKTEEDIAYVDVYFIKNTGVNAWVLTPVYDRDALTLIGYEEGDIIKNIDHTNVESEDDYALEDFKFFWESTKNNYDVGKFLTLKFRVKEGLEANNYFVSFTYKEGYDVTYIKEDKSIWYTKLQIVDGEVPIGLRYTWSEFVITEDDIDIKIESEVGKPYNVKLAVDDVTVDTKKNLDSEYVKSVIGEDKIISSVYSTNMLLNDNEYVLGTKVKIKIKLTIVQKDYPQLYLYRMDVDNKMTLQEFEVVGDYIEFDTDYSVSNWAIVCDKGVVSDGTIGPNTFILILLPSLLAIATMATFLIYLGKKRNKIKFYKISM